MHTPTPNTQLPPAVQRVLDDVRRRIRAYVWLHGLASLVVLLGAAFWIGLALDWLLEPSPQVRQLAYIFVAGLAAYIFYRYLLRRVFVPISDASAASLLERRFPALGEHLLTAVDVAAAPERAATYHPGLVSETQHAATMAVANVHAGELFNRGPLVRAAGGATALVASVIVFAVVSNNAFSFWLDRLALSNELWPRRAHLEVVGFEPDARGHRVHKLAQDDDFELLVRADAENYEVPDEVEIRFELADGRRGRDTMIRVGEAVPGRDEFQLYRYEFKRVASGMTFDVVGGDDRVRDLELRVVDRPELFAIELECIYPEYLARPARRLPVTGGMRIPEGTRLVLHAAATKPLTSARIHSSQTKQDERLEFSHEPQEELRWDYGTLTDDDVLFVNVTDTDEVASREPYRVSLAVVHDEVPQVAVRLAGIGSAVTPDAVLPFTGKITDDYGLDRAWFEFRVGDEPELTRPLAQQPDGAPLLESIGQFDLRAADESTGQRAVQLQPGLRLSLWLKAADRYDLQRDDSDSPQEQESGAARGELRVGSSQQFTLDVVTMAELLALLERREFALRQRFEAIYEKLTDTRELLGRVDFDDSSAVDEDDHGSDGEKNVADGSSAANRASKPANEPSPAGARRALARRKLRIAGSIQNVLQAADEISGVAAGFDDLHDQLTNNRIDNPDLKSRLREQIARPLHRIGDERMPELTAQLKLVEEHLEDAAGPPELTKGIMLADAILVEMKQVLDRMRELENYNEIVGLLRGIIADQEKISRQTKERQSERLRSLFEENEE